VNLALCVPLLSTAENAPHLVQPQLPGPQADTPAASMHANPNRRLVEAGERSAIFGEARRLSPCA
jgi:hypothetical protein